ALSIAVHVIGIVIAFAVANWTTKPKVLKPATMKTTLVTSEELAKMQAKAKVQPKPQPKPEPKPEPKP
ncbi:MAG TPA: protein TolA, partial [Gammaproteobacteria bacterium]|nr:protein TolA [Gammaproteobacteria bacterium]